MKMTNKRADEIGKMTVADASLKVSTTEVCEAIENLISRSPFAQELVRSRINSNERQHRK